MNGTSPKYLARYGLSPASDVRILHILFPPLFCFFNGGVGVGGYCSYCRCILELHLLYRTFKYTYSSAVRMSKF